MRIFNQITLKTKESGLGRYGPQKGYFARMTLNLASLIEATVSYQDMLGDYPTAENGNYILPTTEFGHPNDYKFTVDYTCRRTATGMFSDCGVYSANTAWTADPYKGLNCPLTNTETPKMTTTVSNKRETKYGPPRRTGISSMGTSMLR